MRCKFCDLPGATYAKRPIDEILDDLVLAQRDKKLPVKHVLISGGTGTPSDLHYFDAICEQVTRAAGMPVDVMMTPRRDVGTVDRLVDAGVSGFSLNLEVFDPSVARTVIPQKYALGLDLWAKTIARAAELTGGKGRVRSLIVVGLESVESTCKAIEFLARLGCDPVLSPFRPARGTPLAIHPPPSVQFLFSVYNRAEEICKMYGVRLGPRCIPCQHNTLTFPDRSGDYYYS